MQTVDTKRTIFQKNEYSFFVSFCFHIEVDIQTRLTILNSYLHPATVTQTVNQSCSQSYLDVEKAFFVQNVKVIRRAYVNGRAIFQAQQYISTQTQKVITAANRPITLADLRPANLGRLSTSVVKVTRTPNKMALFNTRSIVRGTLACVQGCRTVNQQELKVWIFL